MKTIRSFLFVLVVLALSFSVISCSSSDFGGAFNNGGFEGPAMSPEDDGVAGDPSVNGGSAPQKPAGDMGESSTDKGESSVDGDYSEGGGSTVAPSYPDSEGGSADMPTPPVSEAPSVEPDSTPDKLPDMDSTVPEEGGDIEDDGTGEETPDNVVLPSGMITAGAWIDNDNYEAWLDLFSQEDGQQGKFYQYTNPDYSWGFNSLKRVKVNVTNGENAVAGATVIASDVQGNPLFSAVTDAQGNAYLFINEDDGEIIVTSGEGSATAEFSKDSRDIEVQIGDSGNKLNVIEIMLVVDVTGSMGDEIDFLKGELADVINRIAANDANTVIKLAMLFYRDTDDKVPFDYYDFTDVTNEKGLSDQQAALNSQRATGGGDYPEAVDEALDMAVNQQWSTGATTKIIFHVLDAPAHEGDKYATKLVNATKIAAEKGIRICPIICSGAASSTEYTMREAAIYTGGTFIFVTDDSGIGGSHHDPEITNITIELLNSMMVRLVKGYHTGTFDEPIYWKQDPNLNNQ